MAEDYVCGECGQRSEEDFCPLCESKMVRIDDYDDTSYDIEDQEEENTGVTTMESDNDFGFDGFEEEMPRMA